MVNKEAKAVKTTLARGRVLPAELLQVLRQGASDATSVFITVIWRDGSTASVRSVDEVEPIEDARNVFAVHGRFDYEDGSNLKMQLRDYREPGNLSAIGDTARTRQAAIGQTWATIPGRARLSKTWDFAIWSISCGLLTGALFQFVFSAVIVAGSWGEISSVGWAWRTAALLLAIAFFVVVRRNTQHRWIARLVTLNRPASQLVEFWTVVAGVGTVVAIGWSVYAYLFPRT
jgi:hypothetical protein